MNILDFSISYLRWNESGLLGILHGVLLSVPLSAPMLLSVRHYVVDGSEKGLGSLLGSVLGQVSFVLLISLGVRPLIQVWYASEPLLGLLGMGLTLHRATSYYNGEKEEKLKELEKGVRVTRLIKLKELLLRIKNVFIFNYVIVLLNPALPASLSRMLLGSDLLVMTTTRTTAAAGGLVALGGGELKKETLGLLLKSWLEKGSCVPYVLSIVLTNVLLIGLLGTLLSYVSKKELGEKNLWLKKLLSNLEAKRLEKILLLLVVGSVVQGGLHYNWRLLTEYPLEYVSSSLKGLLGGESKSSLSNSVLLREFGSFDSNIRHREKNLAVERHLPIERMNARRSLSGREVFTEEQKSSAYIKYGSFFLNRLEKEVSKVKIVLQDKIESCCVKELDKKSLESLEKYKLEEVNTNKTKGSPSASYIRSLLYKGVNVEKELECAKHEDMLVYEKLLK